MSKTAQEQIGVDISDDDQLTAAQPSAAEPLAAPPEAQRPDGLPDNFSSVEALVKSYNEMGGKMREQGTELNELRGRLSQLEAAAQEEPEAPQQSFDTWREQLDSLYEQDPLQAMAYVAQAISQANDQRALQDYQQTQFATQQPLQNASYELIAGQAEQLMAGRYADWEQVKPQIAEMFEQNPNLMTAEEAMSPYGAANAYDRMYRLAKYSELEQAAQQGKTIQAYDPNAGQPPPFNPGQLNHPIHQQAQLLPPSELARLGKMQQQTLTGGNGRLATPDAGDEWLQRMQRAGQQSYGSMTRTRSD